MDNIDSSRYIIHDLGHTHRCVSKKIMLMHESIIDHDYRDHPSQRHL